MSPRAGTDLLLVEDSEVNQQLLSVILEDLGFNVTLSNNGFDAITKLKDTTNSNHFNVIIMDCQMPIMDGYRTTRLIRSGNAGKKYRSIPIIAMTGNSAEGDRKACLGAGMNGYLTKPIDVEKLQKTLNKHIHLTPQGHTLHSTKNVTTEPLADTTMVWDKEEALSRVNNRSDYMTLILNSFLDSINSQIKVLQNALNTGDFGTAKLELHTFKGVAGNISALQFMEIAKVMESLAHEENSRELLEYFPEFLLKLESLRGVLIQYVEETKSSGCKTI